MGFTQLTPLVKVNADLIERWWRKKTDSAVTSVVRANGNSSGNWSFITFFPPPPSFFKALWNLWQIVLCINFCTSSTICMQHLSRSSFVINVILIKSEVVFLKSQFSTALSLLQCVTETRSEGKPVKPCCLCMQTRNIFLVGHFFPIGTWDRKAVHSIWQF